MDGVGFFPCHEGVGWLFFHVTKGVDFFSNSHGWRCFFHPTQMKLTIWHLFISHVLIIRALFVRGWRIVWTHFSHLLVKHLKIKITSSRTLIFSGILNFILIFDISDLIMIICIMCCYPMKNWRTRDWVASVYTIREESSQTNAILQYKLLASILSAVCSVIQQS